MDNCAYPDCSSSATALCGDCKQAYCGSHRAVYLSRSICACCLPQALRVWRNKTRAPTRQHPLKIVGVFAIGGFAFGLWVFGTLPDGLTAAGAGGLLGAIVGGIQWIHPNGTFHGG
jgi:hypothetical protein